METWPVTPIRQRYKTKPLSLNTHRNVSYRSYLHGVSRLGLVAFPEVILGAGFWACHHPRETPPYKTQVLAHQTKREFALASNGDAIYITFTMNPAATQGYITKPGEVGFVKHSFVSLIKDGS